jgi:hypothetical protein
MVKILVAVPIIINNVDAGRIDVYNKSTDVSYSHMRIVHFNGAIEGQDNYDSSYSENPNTLHIYSRNPLCDPSELWIDSRGPNSTTTYNLELLFNKTFLGTANNMLTFVMKDDSNFTWKNIFVGDANDSNDIVADIKHIIDNGSVLPPPYNDHYGDFPLPDVDGSKTGVYDKRKVFFFHYCDFNRDTLINRLDFDIFRENFNRNNETDPNTFGSYVGSEPNNYNAYADIDRNGAVGPEDLDIFKTYFRFSGDLNLDGRVDNTDYAYFAPDWNARNVNSISDISGPNGVPDKNVDYWDLSAFSDDYLRDINEPSTWSRAR